MSQTKPVHLKPDGRWAVNFGLNCFCVQVIVPDTASSTGVSSLAEHVRSRLDSDVMLTAVQRAIFSDVYGRKCVEELAVADHVNLIHLIEDKLLWFLINPIVISDWSNYFFNFQTSVFFFFKFVSTASLPVIYWCYAMMQVLRIGGGRSTVPLPGQIAQCHVRSQQPESLLRRQRSDGHNR